MRIKEMEDVLVLVDALPEDQQRRLARRMVRYVDEWEAQTAEGVEDDRAERNVDGRRPLVRLKRKTSL